MADRPVIRIKRVYEPPADDDGLRVLVDRLWPRGLKKADARIDLWAKDLAPSTDLRRWFNHDPEKFDEFSQRYREELDSRPNAIEQLFSKSAEGRLTLLYAARDETHNHAVVLREVLIKLDS